MKATLNIRNIAKTSAVALTIVLASVVTPVKAASEDLAGNREIRAAIDRLERYNQVIEESIGYAFAEVSETAAFEMDLAWLRLEETANLIESVVSYEAPEVAEDIIGYETNTALENLAQLNRKVEHSIRYAAPSVTE